MLELQLTDIMLRYSQGYIYVDGKVNGQWVQLIREQSAETKGPISHCVSISQSTLAHLVNSNQYPAAGCLRSN